MKKYTDGFALWLDLQDGTLDAQWIAEEIWEITEISTCEKGYVFSDETQNFHPTIYPTIGDACKGYQEYCEKVLGTYIDK